MAEKLFEQEAKVVKVAGGHERQSVGQELAPAFVLRKVADGKDAVVVEKGDQLSVPNVAWFELETLRQVDVDGEVRVHLSSLHVDRFDGVLHKRIF